MRSLIWVAPLCAGLGACNATPDPIGLQPGETLLSVTGTGRTEATPDQALFTAGLSSIAMSASTLRSISMDAFFSPFMNAL